MDLSIEHAEEIIQILHQRRTPANFEWLGSLLSELSEAVAEAKEGKASEVLICIGDES